jgi:mannose-1-phosphate guanylyltransferase
MVLAAGLGSRLRPLSDVCPKPLVPVGDRPALAHVLDRLAAGGVSRVVVNAHHGLPQMERFVAGRSGVALSREAELLGTAGGVSFAGPLLDEGLGAGDVLVWNADILVDLDPRQLVADHAGAPARDATLVVQRRQRGQGSVGLDGEGRIVRLRGERVADEAHGGEFLGVHMLGAGLRARLPKRGCLVGDLYIPAMQAGARLQAWVWTGTFFDIGSVATYLTANLAWLSARGLDAWVGPGARVSTDVSLRRTLVGEGASVRGAGLLDACVVWPGVSVAAPMSATVAAPGRLVRVPPC